MEFRLRRPWVGIAALLLVSLWRVLAHNISVLGSRFLPDEIRLVAGLVVGTIGFILVWVGLNRDELTSSLLGFAGGAMIWLGWFEHLFEFLAKAIGVQPLIWNGVYSLPPNLVLLEATSFVLLVMLIFLWSNKDTGCRMFMFFHRNLRLRPGTPTRGYRKAYSRLAAMEYVLVSWFMYAAILLVIDPRIVGLRSPLAWAAMAGVTVWSIYLAVWKLPAQENMGGAVRYAIGAGGIIWLAVELAAQLKIITEVWVKPVQMPLTNLAFWVAFWALFVVVALVDQRGQAAVLKSGPAPTSQQT